MGGIDKTDWPVRAAPTDHGNAGEIVLAGRHEMRPAKRTCARQIFYYCFGANRQKGGEIEDGRNYLPELQRGCRIRRVEAEQPALSDMRFRSERFRGHGRPRR